MKLGLNALEALEPRRIAMMLDKAEIDYQKASTERMRHFRVERVRTAGEVGPWCVAKTGNPEAPAIYESKAGILCVNVETITLHGKRRVKGDDCEHRTLHVERINFR